MTRAPVPFGTGPHAPDPFFARQADMKRIYLVALSAAALAVGTIGVALGDDDDNKREGVGSRGLGAVENPAYRTECGSCHVAYPPKLLPADA